MFFGVLIERFDERHLTLIMVGTYILVYALFKMFTGYIAFVVLIGALGFTSGGILPLLTAMVASGFGAQSVGTVMGLLAPFLTLTTFGAMLAGWTRDVTGSYDMMFNVLIFIVMPSIISVLLVKTSNTEDGLPAPLDPTATVSDEPSV